MRPLPEAAGVRIADERAVEEWVQLSIERVMPEPVAHARLVDVARLGVAYPEVVVAAVAVCACREVLVETEDVCHQVPPELLHINACALPFYEFSPRVKQILDRDDILV